MDSQTFVKELEAANQGLLAKFGDAETLPGESPVKLKQLLPITLANEISVSELAAAWMPSTPEVDVKIALAQQAGDETNHFTPVQDRVPSSTNV